MLNKPEVKIPVWLFAIVWTLIVFLPATARAQVDGEADGGEALSLKIVHIAGTREMEANWGQGGLASVSGLIDDLYGEHEHVILTHGGAALSPSILSYFDRGRHMIDLLNRSDVAVMGLAHNEFDFGLEVLSQRASEAYFPMLASNLRRPGGVSVQGIQDNWTLDIEGYRIAFYALVDPETRVTSSAGDAIFLNPATTAEQQTMLLREAGADLIICLASLDEEDYRPIVEAGHTDIVLGYEGEDLLIWEKGETLYARSEPEAEQIVVLTVNLETELIEVVSDEEGANLESLVEEADEGQQDAALLSLLQPTEVREQIRRRVSVQTFYSADYEPDTVMAAAVQGYQFSLPRAMSRVVGELAGRFNTSEVFVRQYENAFGNWVADALRAAAGTEVGLVNSGYIRGNQEHEPGELVTWRSLVEELPFVNRVISLRRKGTQLRQVLEHSVSEDAELTGRFLQVSGITVTYDPAQPVGERVIDLSVGGEPLMPERSYSVAVPEFLAQGGDGFRSFRYADVYEHPRQGIFVIEALSEYLAGLDSLKPRVDGRISIKTAPRPRR